MSFHVYPTSDERPHDTESLECWCDPAVEYLDPDGIPYPEGPLIIHHAADCRELIEEAERITQEGA